MDHFNYKKGILYSEDVSIEKIASNIGTPFYCYSSATLIHHYKIFQENFASRKHIICYSVKSNSNIAIVKTLSELNSGGDCVSEGEIRRCKKAGIPSSKIVFSGIGKTKEEISYGLKEKILQFNVESEEELYTLNEIAKSLDIKAPIAFRVNPHVDAKTHNKITTGRKEDKFGIDYNYTIEMYKKASALENINIQGIATHIGSQITSLEPLKKSFIQVRQLFDDLTALGYNIKYVDFGGGLGIPYYSSDNLDNPNTQPIPTPKDYADMVLDIMKGTDCCLIFEPGRVITGNAGILVSKVIYLKDTGYKKFLIVDAAMNDLVRPTIYDGYHEVIPVVEPNEKSYKMDVVGPICETGDILAHNRNLPLLSPGSLLALRSSGAYGATMASEYNSRLLIPEILVNGNEYCLIRERNTYEQMLSKDIIPKWL